MLKPANREFFPQPTQAKITQILSECMGPYIQTVVRKDKPVGLDEFLEKAIRAIATYTQRRVDEKAFGRAGARRLLLDACRAVLKAKAKLDAIVMWRELARYLERVYCQSTAEAEPSGGKKSQPMSARRAFKMRMEARDRRREAFRSFDPEQTALVLGQLQTVLTLACEKTEFQPGDFQRDQIAQDFVNDLVWAWMSGTGRIPTYAKPSPRSRNPSPFANLLATINNKILMEHRSRNDFRDYAEKAIRRLRSNRVSGVRGQPPFYEPGSGR